MTTSAGEVGTVVSGKEKYFAPDFIRTVAIVLVIVIHVVCPYLNDFSHKNFWHIANYIESAARPCVPLFFMLTGSLLLGSQSVESIMTFYKKRFGRILIPFFFWAAVYFAWRHFHHHEPMHLSKILHELYSGPIFYHFGFMFTLISLYLVTPFLRILVRGSSHANLLWLVAFWFVGQTLPAATIKFFHAGFAYPVELVTKYSGYFLAGYCFAKIRPSRTQTILLVAMVLAAYAATVCGTETLNAGSRGSLDEFFYDYFSPNVIVMSVGWFILLLNIGHRIRNVNNISKIATEKIGSMTLGIYLMQSLIIEILDVSWKTHTPLVFVPVMTLYVLAICIVLCLALSRLPGLKAVV